MYIAIALTTCIFSGLAAAFAFLSWRGRKILVPNLSVCFPDGKSSRMAPHDELAKVILEIRNIGKEVGENVETHIFFPPEFDISDARILFPPESDSISDLNLKKKDWLSKEKYDSEFPNYWNAIFFVGDIGPKYHNSIEISVRTPETSRGYEIFVDTICKGTGTKTHRLLLNVV